MAKIKTPQEIALMKEGGEILAQALRAAAALVKPGVAVKDIDAEARRVIEAAGGKPSFLGYVTYPGQDPFPSTLCVSVNDEVVHGLGNRKTLLREGDVVGLDIGMWYKGLATDMAITVPVGTVSAEHAALMERTRESLLRGLAVVKDGASVRSIGKTIQAYLQPFGYGIVRDLVGHGVGHKVHEGPNIPHYDEPLARDVLKTGMTIAVEPMIILGGDSRVYTAADDWTVKSQSGKVAAHFEVTVAVTDDGYELVTPFV